MSDTWSYGRKGAAYRRIDLEREALNAEWNVPPGRIGGLVRQHRRRAHVASVRTMWVLGALIATVLVGLTYYVGLPIWVQLQDAAKRGYETEARLLGDEMTAMDIARDDVWTEIAAAVELVASPIEADFEGRSIIASTILDEGQRYLGVGSAGLVAQSFDSGQNWNVQTAPVAGRDIVSLFVDADEKRLLGFTRSGLPLGANDPDLQLTAYSTDGGTTWRRSEGDRMAGWLGQTVRLKDDAGFLVQVGTAIFTSPDFGKTWSRIDIPSPDGELRTFLFHENSALLVVGAEGFIARSDDLGQSWTPAETVPTKDTIDGIYADNNGILFAYPEDSDAVFYSRDGGLNWSVQGDDDQDGFEVPVIIEDPMGDGISLGDKTYIFDYDDTTNAAAIFVQANGTDTTEKTHIFENIDYFSTEPGVSADGTAILAQAEDLRGNAAFVASTDSGENWRRIPVAGPPPDNAGRFFGGSGNRTLPAKTGRAFLIETNGPSYRVDARFAAALSGASRLPGSPGDAILRAELGKLPEPLLSDPVMSPLVTAFEASIEDRTLVEEDLDNATAQAAEIVGSGYSPAQRRADYVSFMAECLTNEAASSESCTSAYVNLRDAESSSVWEIFAERAPQAILVLFLLATLGGLYRYNMRMSGFHHSRADALELLSLGRGDDAAPLSSEALAEFVQMADIMAADKVEFGRSNNPTDQAIELARAISGRGRS